MEVKDPSGSLLENDNLTEIKYQNRETGGDLDHRNKGNNYVFSIPGIK